jgi:hypothetical protein
MNRKLLFVLFSDDACRRNHAFLYAIDLSRKGIEVKLIVEGPATRLFAEAADRQSAIALLLDEARSLGILAGACARASAGCASTDPSRFVEGAVRDAGVPLLSDLQGHAGIAPFVEAGYELVIM